MVETQEMKQNLLRKSQGKRLLVDPRRRVKDLYYNRNKLGVCRLD